MTYNDLAMTYADCFAVGMACAGRVTCWAAGTYAVNKKSLSLARRVLCELL